jgi:hypothetical protein
MNGGEEECVEVIVGKPDRKKPLGKPRHRCVGNIKVGLVEIEWGGLVWTDLARDRHSWRALVMQ